MQQVTVKNDVGSEDIRGGGGGACSQAFPFLVSPDFLPFEFLVSKAAAGQLQILTAQHFHNRDEYLCTWLYHFDSFRYCRVQANHGCLTSLVVSRFLQYLSGGRLLWLRR